MCGTELAYGAGTELAYGAMRCAVLSSRMVLPVRRALRPTRRPHSKGRPPIGLRACYAMPCTKLGYATTTPSPY
eukprot:3940849-Rhodomonas_salina.1